MRSATFGAVLAAGPRSPPAGFISKLRMMPVYTLKAQVAIAHLPVAFRLQDDALNLHARQERGQFPKIDGLHQHVIEAGAHSFGPAHRKAADPDDAGSHQQRIPTQFARYVESRGVGKPNVEQYDVGDGAVREVDGRQAV